MAACHAASSGPRVLLIERTADGGRKILISGGGRCNVLPSALNEQRFVTASSANTLRKVLRSWPLAQQRHFFEEVLGLPLVLEPETGKLFPVADKSRAVRDALVEHARHRGVDWIGNTLVTSVQPLGQGWRIFASDRHFDADTVILATGGLSVPATGSDGFGLACAAQLGHTVHPTYPALTPITQQPPAYADLAGVSLPVTITASSPDGVRTTEGGFLFTHRGYSGPALLDVSHVAVRSALSGGARAQLRVRWTAFDDAEWERQLAPSAQSIAAAVRAQLPTRLADRLLSDAAIDGRIPLAQLARASRRRLIDGLTRCPLPWTGDEGYKKAEVTGGGVALEDVHTATLESRRHPGLFFAGEVLDAFGPIGGYNFVWAWATGRLAALGAVARTAKQS